MTPHLDHPVCRQRTEPVEQRRVRQRVERLAFGHRPQPHRAVVTARGHPAAKGIDDHVPHLRSWPEQQMRLAAIRCAQSHRAILASRDHLFARRMPGDAGHLVAVGRQRCRSAGLEVVDCRRCRPRRPDAGRREATTGGVRPGLAARSRACRTAGASKCRSGDPTRARRLRFPPPGGHRAGTPRWRLACRRRRRARGPRGSRGPTRARRSRPARSVPLRFLRRPQAIARTGSKATARHNAVESRETLGLAVERQQPQTRERARGEQVASRRRRHFSDVGLQPWMLVCCCRSRRDPG